MPRFAPTSKIMGPGAVEIIGFRRRPRVAAPIRVEADWPSEPVEELVAAN
jgi:hypothetical protein